MLTQLLVARVERSETRDPPDIAEQLLVARVERSETRDAPGYRGVYYAAALRPGPGYAISLHSIRATAAAAFRRHGVGERGEPAVAGEVLQGHRQAAPPVGMLVHGAGHVDLLGHAERVLD